MIVTGLALALANPKLQADVEKYDIIVSPEQGVAGWNDHMIQLSNADTVIDYTRVILQLVAEAKAAIAQKQADKQTSLL